MIVFREPQEVVDWFVAFHETSCAWYGRLVPGRFKHVSLVGYAPLADAWVFFEVTFANARIVLLPKGQLADAQLADWTKDCAVLKFRARESGAPLVFRGFLTCVSFAKHMLGVQCVGPLPDNLYRALIGHGAQVVYDGNRERRRRREQDDGAVDAAPIRQAAAGHSGSEEHR
jgi:hypothetical protein